MDKKRKTKLGLDLGTSSIGWWLYEIDDNEEIVGTVRAGVRIFSNGRNPKSFSSLNEDRRAARSARRRRDRYLQRRRGLMKVLIKHGLMPKDEAERKKLVVEDPYKLRAEAATKSISPFLVGRALFHINQRRGFKSNRIIDRSRGSDDGPVLASVKHFKQKLNGQTVGQFLWEHRQEGRPVRARREGTKQDDLYDHYPDRGMLKEEFERIWECQQKGEHGKLYTPKARDELAKLIFEQRKLKDPIIGKCLYYPKEDRISKSSPLFQKFRILQEVNNLRYRDDRGLSQAIEGKARQELLSMLGSKKQVKFKYIKDIIKKHELASYPRLNLESFGRAHLDGDLTRAVLTKKKIIDPKTYDAWSLEEQEELVTLLDSDKSDEAAIEDLTTQWGMTHKQAEDVLQANLPADRGNLSAKAINKLLPFLEDGVRYDEAVEQAGLGSHSDRGDKDAKQLSVLPNYNRILKKYCLPRRKEDEDKHHLWRVPNPTVHVALNQLRNVVNDLLRKYGRPEKIVVEIGRDLPQGKKTKEKLQKRLTENRKANDKRVEKLEELGQQVNYRNIELLRIWEEQGEDCADRRCVYTGEKISARALFSGEVDVDHILPFSKTFDNGIANKVVCYAPANRYKGNKTPFEAFYDNKDYDWEQIRHRAGLLPENKAWRFEEDAMKQYEEKHDFFDRQIPEMQYLTRAALEYLKPVSETGEVIPIPGSFTAMMRRLWGLNSLLGASYKNRSDHRHHAIDAAVVGSVSRSLLNKLTSSAKHYEENISQHRLFDGKTPEPYPEFRKKVKTQVKKIIVSHKNERSAAGQLHNETAMGILEVKPDGNVLVSVRKPVSEFTTPKRIDHILSKRINEELMDLYSDCADKKDFSTLLDNYSSETGIKKIKAREKFASGSLVFINDKNGHPYKAYKLDGNWCYEIYAKPDGKWHGEIIPTFHGNNSSFKPAWTRIDGAKFVMRIFRKDTFMRLSSNGKKSFYVIQWISRGMIALHEHQEANVDSRNRDKEDSFSFLYKSPDVLRKEGYKKVHISAAGITKISD